MAGIWSPTWVGDRLREEFVISAPQLRLALQNMKLYNERIEEALLRIGAIDESRLLRFIAEKCRTHYVSTAKLARLEVPLDALRRVSERTAEKLLAFPVRYEDETQTLTLVSPDAGNPEHVKQIAIATGLKNLKVYVTRPAAVKAAIGKWYRGEIQAFAQIAPDTFTQIQPTRGSQMPPRARDEDWLKTPLPAVAGAAPGRVSSPLADRAARGVERDRGAPQPARDPPSSGSIAVAAPYPAAPAVAESPTARAGSGPDRRLLDIAEILNVLVTLNENARDEFRGHSASVSRLSHMMAQRMGLDELTTLSTGVAANLHDLGKTALYHLTALNVSEQAPYRTAAQKLAQMPLRLLESVDLPQAATDAVGAMYERFDGQGFPGRLSAKDIPLGARILALADTYSDLTLNPRNPYRRTLAHSEAMEVLSRFKGTIFDPDFVDLLGHLVAGEDLRRKLGENAPFVLLVEPNPEEATLIELRLVAQGFEVKVARTSDQALAFALEGTVHFVLCETELQPFDGFELLRRLHRNEATSDLPFVFVARASDTATIDRAFALGAQDYVIKPTSGDVLAAKLRRLGAPKSKRDVATGVAGSLSEMGVPDLAQIMAHGRKGGRLLLRNKRGSEGEVHFQSGRIVHAVYGQLRGADAFYELLSFTDGTFHFDPNFQPSDTTIDASHENLILEGLRRLDERTRDAH